jgi:hypothetical protein
MSTFYKNDYPSDPPAPAYIDYYQEVVRACEIEISEEWAEQLYVSASAFFNSTLKKKEMA